ncbi:isocitrate dehydrogenase [NAD] subunit beta, mitochondrial-like [Empidonax traillii]|uniref:isocitrate dehydrogenase [NAD] subunit beta, mitochondrial-like n=1 Tax=Empidonax traillii TaxID=164674 RepID=UPI000FFD1797|nr:isocitrate dehydrogenase [NAD] subunit beta, mitochondrial-like [Empidonax traillii]
MKRSKLALGKAIESGDTDLVYTVVLHLKNELNRGTFFMTLQNQPVALSLYRQFCRHQERDTLKDLYNQDDNHQELGNFHVHSSYSEKRIEGRVAALQNALDEFNKARNDFAAKVRGWDRTLGWDGDPGVGGSLALTSPVSLQSQNAKAEGTFQVTMLPGDGVGPELMHAVKEVFKAANVPVVFDEHHLSEVQNTASEEKLDRVVDSMKESKVALIGKIHTPMEYKGDLASYDMRLR